MLTIQPFSYSDDDYRVAIAIDAAIQGEAPESLAEWKHYDESRSKEYAYYRDLVQRDGTIIAFVETYQSQFYYHPQKFECRIYVHPDHDAPDIRPMVLDAMLDRLRDHDLIAITSGMLDDKPEATRFFEEYAFKKVAEEKISKLDVTQFDTGQFESALQRVRAGGIEIITLRVLQGRDLGWQRKLFDLDVTVNRDIPSTGEKHYPAFEEWCAMRLEGPTSDPDAWFVALDGEHYVGQSQGSINTEGESPLFVTGVTTTRREYRRRGIALALKVHIIRYAQAQGVQAIWTANDSTNPMYQLNLKLGFEPQPSWVRVEKSLKE